MDWTEYLINTFSCNACKSLLCFHCFYLKTGMTEYLPDQLIIYAGLHGRPVDPPKSLKRKSLGILFFEYMFNPFVLTFVLTKILCI